MSRSDTGCRLRAPRLTWLPASMLACALSLPAGVARAAAGPPTLRVPPARVRAWQTGLGRPDRLEHASLSFTLAAGTGLAGGTRTNAFLLSLGLGALKELRDRHHGGFDPVDLAAGALGAALGARAAGRH
jgi:hypothetical protein